MKLETKFQDKDFDLGEVVEAKVTTYYNENKVVVMADKARGGVSRFEYNSIKDFTDHWEDAPKESKEYWTVDCGMAIKYTWFGLEHDRAAEAVGLKFDTKEECERSIEKMKAWTRLKDKGFRFDGYDVAGRGGDDVICGQVYFKAGNYNKEEIENDLYLLFGGEE